MPAFEETAAEPGFSAIPRGWIRRESCFQGRGYRGTGDDGSIDYAERSSDLLISAPHAVNHFCDGAPKVADRRTGGLSKLLGDRLGVASLAPVGAVDDWRTWPERADPFRRALDRSVRRGALVVDLHGMKDSHGVDVCLGFGPRPSGRVRLLAEALTAALAPLHVARDVPFDGCRPHTVTSYVQDVLGADALQIEIAARHRDPAARPDLAARLVLGLDTGLRDFLARGGVFPDPPRLSAT